MSLRFYRHSKPFYYLVRLVNGANTQPLFGKKSTTARRVMQVVLFVSCCLDLVLFSLVLIFGRIYLCPHPNTGEGYQCAERNESMPYLVTLMMVWPGAAFISSVGGIFIHSSQLKTNWLRMYSAWSRLCTAPVILFIFFFFYFNFGEIDMEGAKKLTQQLLVNVAGLMVVSRILQITITDQYIALAERIRWTLGWDGLMTAIFMTKDDRRDVQHGNSNPFSAY
jgi:hypothetical protein